MRFQQSDASNYSFSIEAILERGGKGAERENEIDLKMAIFASVESPGTDGDEPN